MSFDTQISVSDGALMTYQESWHAGTTVLLGGFKEAKPFLQSFEVLLVCWPPRESMFVVQALRLFQGHFFVFIGEGWLFYLCWFPFFFLFVDAGGLTGDSFMFHELSKWSIFARKELDRKFVKKFFGCLLFFTICQLPMDARVYQHFDSSPCLQRIGVPLHATSCARGAPASPR